MLTRKTALCSLYLPSDADDGAADECRLTGDERVHVAGETMAGLSPRERRIPPRETRRDTDEDRTRSLYLRTPRL